MSFFEDIAKAAMSGGFNTQSFGGPGYESVWSQLKPWLGRITTNGVIKWLPRAASQMPCQVPQYEHGLPVGPCTSHALELCLVCSRPVCLSHAFIDGAEGNAVCYLCVVSMKKTTTTKDAPPQPQQDSKKEEALKKAWWARGVFSLQEDAPWSEVKKQHKVLSAQFHPDKAGGDERRFKDVQTAYDTLKLIYGEN